MKDLYKRIGIHPNELDLHVIRRALDRPQLDPADRADAEFVLLHPERRRLYDRWRVSNAQIGRLRLGLGLNDTPLAHQSKLGDFLVPSRSRAEDQSASNDYSSSEAHQGGKWADFKDGLYTVGIVGVILIGVVAFLSQIGGDPESPTASASKKATGSAISSGTDHRLVPDAASPSTSSSGSPATTQPHVDLLQKRTREASEFVERRAEQYPQWIPRSEAEQILLAKRLVEKQGIRSPLNGAIIESTDLERVAPLEIVTRSNRDYYVKLKRKYSNETVLSFYVSAGSRAEVTVPLGVYELVYASGSTWYGPGLDFGLEASYAKADSDFAFRETYSGYEGYTVELFLQVDGNLETRPIDESSF